MNRVKLVLLVPLALLGWTVLSVLVGVTVGKAIKEHLDPSDPLDPEDLPERQEYQETLDWWEKLDPKASLDLWAHQVLSDHLDPSDPQARHPQS